MADGPDEDSRRLTAALALWIAERRPTVTVVGDAILDGWLSGECHRLCREAPAPVLDVVHRRFAPGGAANTAVNLAALGARTRLVAALGDDREGTLLREQLLAADVDVTGLVTVPGRITTVKRRLVAGVQLLARVDETDDGPLPDTACRELREHVAAVDSAAVLVCDYGLGLFDEAMVAALGRVRAEAPVFAVDAHDVTRWSGLRPDFVTPNLGEAADALGVGLPGGLDDVPRHAPDLRRVTGATSVVVTGDRHGSVLCTEGLPEHRTWAEPAPDHQTAGAGDTYVAAVCVARAVGLPMTTAVELGQAAADVVVHQSGTSVCTSGDLAERLGRFRDAALPTDLLADRVAAHRKAGRTIVFTNGCFDVLHRGHVAYLNQAKRLGDILVVGVNSDASVTRLKGTGRPVNTAEDRAAVLAALSCVDHVTVFDQDDATELVDRLCPDVYAKGGDYTPEMLPETDAVRRRGGEVHILDYLSERSSSSVIERIRSSVGVAEPA